MIFLDFLKKRWKYVLTAFIALILGAATGPTQEQFDDSKAEVASLTKQISKLESENNELQTKVDEAAPWFKLSAKEKKEREFEAKKAEEKRLAEEAAKKEAEEKANAEAQAKAKAEAEAKEKIGYNTGITYNQLARTPDDFKGEKVEFKGKVIQVMEGEGEVQVRIAINDNYDTILYGVYLSSITNSRILEDDYITIYGISTGLISYQSTMSGQISIPGVLIQKIEH